MSKSDDTGYTTPTYRASGLLKNDVKICGDRTNLVAHGFNAVSFAYPYAEFTNTTKG